MTETTTANGYTEEETAFLRERFEAWKEEVGVGVRNKSLVGDPRFRAALDLVINTHGYAQAEIAEWLGVSRERVRQWCAQTGVRPKVKGSRYRYWDGERFTPDFERTRRAARARVTRQGREKKRAQYWAETFARRRRYGIRRLQEQARELGRAPTATEAAAYEGLAHGQMAVLAYRFGRNSDERYAQFLDGIWAEAGFERPDGRTLNARSGDEQREGA